MANHKSAMKRIRQTERRYERNKANKSRLRTQLKAFHQAASEGSREAVDELLVPTISLVDKSVQKGILHRNKGNRLKSSVHDDGKQTEQVLVEAWSVPTAARAAQHCVQEQLAGVHFARLRTRQPALV